MAETFRFARRQRGPVPRQQRGPVPAPVSAMNKSLARRNKTASGRSSTEDAGTALPYPEYVCVQRRPAKYSAGAALCVSIRSPIAGPPVVRVSAKRSPTSAARNDLDLSRRFFSCVMIALV